LLASIDQRSEIWNLYEVRRIVVDAPYEAERANRSPSGRRVALLRPLVWTAGFLETSLGKHLEQLRWDRLVEHILSTADQRFVEIDMRQGQMVAGPASCRHLAALRSTRQSSSRAMSSNERRASLFREMDRRQRIQAARRPSVSWRHTTRPVVELPHNPFVLIEHLRGEHLRNLELTPATLVSIIAVASFRKEQA
jgi:hypothetical protein